MKYYADYGINWIFVYGVLYEDDCILILKDMGRFHQFDEDRKCPYEIEEWVEIRLNSGYVYKTDGKKLVEVQWK